MGEKLARACRRSAETATQWILDQLKVDGSFGEAVADLSAFYKLPMLFALTGRPRDAHRVLGHINAAFGRSEGGYRTEEEQVTADPALADSPGAISAWIALAALRAGRFDLALPAYAHLGRFVEPSVGGAAHREVSAGDPIIDVAMTAQVGLAALYFGEHGRAVACGKALGAMLDAQSAPDARMLLRMSPAGQWALPIDDRPESYAIEKGRPDQMFALIGHPIGFATHLYRATGEASALDVARRYAQFALDCGDALVASHYAHAVAWGVALAWRATGDGRHRELAEAIADQLIESQEDDGGWLSNDAPAQRLDQSAEAAIWLTELSALL